MARPAVNCVDPRGISVLARPIPGYVGYYATELGTIISTRKGHKRALHKRQGNAGSEDVQVQGPAGRRKTVPVHRLVCLAFHGPAPKGKNLVRHLDGDNKNNTPGNLAWGTHQENMHDKRGHGTNSRNMDERHVRLIKMLLETKSYTQVAIAKAVGLSESTIRDIKRGTNWGHVQVA